MGEFAESDSFHWHCEVAAIVMNNLPGNAATKHYIRDAIRMATLCLARSGQAPLVSSGAREIIEANGDDWSKRGLVREHTVPVSEIYDQVFLALAFPAIRKGNEGMPGFMSIEERGKRLRKGEGTLVLGNPRPWQIAQIIRRWTVLCWVTKEEDALLRQEKLHDSMPADWDGQDKFARYKACGIAWSAME